MLKNRLPLTFKKSDPTAWPQLENGFFHFTILLIISAFNTILIGHVLGISFSYIAHLSFLFFLKMMIRFSILIHHIESEKIIFRTYW